MMMSSIRLFCLLLISVLVGSCNGDDQKDTNPDATSPSVVVGTTALEIDARDEITRTNETGIGNLLVDLLKSGLEAKGHSVDIGLFNAGAIRGKDDDAGPVYAAGSELTENTLETLLKFSDDHEIVTLTGTQFKSVLERGVRSLPIDLTGDDRGGQFPLLSGARYTVTCDNTRQTLNADSTAVETPGTRITFIEVAGSVIYDVDNSIDTLDAVSYTLASSTFVTAGKDGHVALTELTTRVTVPEVEFDLAQALKDNVKANSPISLTPDTPPRISFVGDCNKAL